MIGISRAFHYYYDTAGSAMGLNHLFSWADSLMLAVKPNSGSSTGPHLHVSLRNPQGVKIDPQAVFSFQ